MIFRSDMRTKTNRERDGWTGPVKTVVTETAEFSQESGKWVLRPRRLDFTLTYDRSGGVVDESYGANVIFDLTSSDDGTVKRDAEGNVIEQEVYRNGVLEYRIFFTRDAEGKEVEQVVRHADGLLAGRKTHRYDSHGRAVEMNEHDAGGTIITRCAYANKYDSEKNLIEVTVERWTNVAGEFVYEPLFTTYHTITYY